MKLHGLYLAVAMLVIAGCTSPSAAPELRPSSGEPAPASPAPTPSTRRLAPSPPVMLPPSCSATATGGTEWRVDCGDERNLKARAILAPLLAQGGWRPCPSGLLGHWGKRDSELLIRVSLGAGSDGFGLAIRPISADCAVSASVADPARAFEVMTSAYLGRELAWTAARWVGGAALFRTVDGGTTWTTLDIPTELNYVAELHFP